MMNAKKVREEEVSNALREMCLVDKIQEQFHSSCKSGKPLVPKVLLGGLIRINERQDHRTLEHGC